MAIRKTESGWKVDIQPGGRSGLKRYRKTFQTKAEALAYEAFIRRKYIEGEPWGLKKKDQTRLSELIDLWFSLHGKQLKDTENRLRILKGTCERLGDPLAVDLSPSMFTRYRATRLTSVKPNTVNHEQAYLSAVYGTLVKFGEWKHGNPLAGLPKIKHDEAELSWLNHEQIQRLLSHMDEMRNKDAALITRLCLSTGARWSEAENLKRSHVLPGRVHFVGTKSRRNRFVPISPDLEQDLRRRLNKGPFDSSYNTFTTALTKAEIDLPRGQRTHVLRHTFASHFVMNGGNILTLQKILGHSDIKMTMRYAHLAPEHLNEAVRMNPISKMT
ncbi:phage integrase [Marinobacterium arenosum]|uniref:phage integrase n=1 Tax=Marinobacterium arenosum TaxID=2862496 RepID=UPI001C94A6CC|nr:tyrosine-type recombinase/integrase [Marinobacterium arenosum]MBY4675909.1 tyrosine-type recombinase/integrase [Marinobacterium arenosum]